MHTFHPSPLTPPTGLRGGRCSRYAYHMHQYIRRIPVATIALVLIVIIGSTASSAELSGTVITSDGEPIAGAFITIRDGKGVATTVPTSVDGSFTVMELATGSYEVRARAFGFKDLTTSIAITDTPKGQTFSLAPVTDLAREAPASMFLGTLPEGVEKRRLIVDCMGCHALNPRIVYSVDDGHFLNEAEWKTSVDKMLSFAGHKTPFPILPPDRLSEPTVRFVAKYMTEAAIGEAVEKMSPRPAALVRHTITEWDMPEQRDFPHDLMRDRRGNVLVTGMFSGLMYVLDPKTGEFSTVKIPLDMANPRALDVDADGNWWVMCGAPKKAARYTVATQQWDVFDIGMYPHSTMIDAKNRVWFNGHFTNKPILMGFLDGATGEVSTIEVPPNLMSEAEGGPLPYGLRVAPDGTVWSTELAGNRLVRLDPATGDLKTYTMPTPYSGPRRLDVGPDGSVWIPEFARGKLAHFDPKTEALTEHDFPTANSLPYCARVDHTTGYVWVSQCANDAIARFDPRTETFTEFRLPTRDAFIRHLDVDSETGEVWGAYSHSPGLQQRIVRLKVE